MVVDVVRRIVRLRREDEAHRARAEAFERPPDHPPHEETLVRPRQGHDTSLGSIVEHDVEASGRGHEQLLEPAVRVATAVSVAGNGGKEVDAAYREGNV